MLPISQIVPCREKSRPRQCHSVVELVLHSHPCLRVTAFPLVNCLDFPADDQEDQEVGEGDNTVEDQMGEQQPGPAADG